MNHDDLSIGYSNTTVGPSASVKLQDFTAILRELKQVFPGVSRPVDRLVMRTDQFEGLRERLSEESPEPTNPSNLDRLVGLPIEHYPTDFQVRIRALQYAQAGLLVGVVPPESDVRRVRSSGTVRG